MTNKYNYYKEMGIKQLKQIESNTQIVASQLQGDYWNEEDVIKGFMEDLYDMRMKAMYIRQYLQENDKEFRLGSYDV